MFKPVLLSAAVLASLAGPAQATLEISTTARGLTSSVRVVGQPLTFVGPIATVSGRTSPGYNLTGGVASFGTTVGLGTVLGIAATLGINSGSIATAASANGTTPANTTMGSASATLNNLNIALSTSTLGIPTQVLGITATQVQSLTSGNRPVAAVTLSGQSIFTGLNINLAGVPIYTLGSNQQVAPNFVVYDVAGLRITLNQQFFSIYDNTRVLVTNAIGVRFTNYLLDGRSLSGEIVAGQSLAEFMTDTVPEPASWAQLLAGFGLIGALARRRRLPAPA